MNDEPKHKHRARGRTGQLGKINRIRSRARGRSDFVLQSIRVDHAAAMNKAEARTRYGT